MAKRWLRRLTRSAWLRRGVCWIAHLYIRFVFVTNRWRVDGGEIPHRIHASGRALIFAFWHGRMMMIPTGSPRLAPVSMLISGHRDGRFIADAVSYFDINVITGSSRRGGSSALRAMLKRLADGEWVGITPDGPRGPAMTASTGIVTVARLAGVPVVPVVFATSRRRVLNTWDRFYLGLPFGRGLYLWGEPIEVPADLDEAGLERTRLLIEARMNELAREADRRIDQRAAIRPVGPRHWTGLAGGEHG